MGTLLKWLVGLVLALVLLVVAAVIILPMVVDPNDYKPQIIEAAKQQLGRDLAIEKDLGLSVFPWLGIETGGVRVGNAPGFSDQPFAEVETVGLKVKLMPLLSKRVEVDTLVLTGLNVNLEKDQSGKTNWDDLAGAELELEWLAALGGVESGAVIKGSGVMDLDGIAGAGLGHGLPPSVACG
jgi:AsmA protein